MILSEQEKALGIIFHRKENLRKNYMRQSEPFFQVLAGYFYVKWKIILLYCFVIGFFFIVCFLYNVPIEPAQYAGIMSGILLGIVGTADFFRYYQKRRQLFWMREKIKNEIDGLPEPKETLEEQYQELLFILQEEKRRVISMMDERYSEMMHYYTLWVHQIKTPIAAMRLLLQVSQEEQKAEMEQELFKIEQYVEMVLGYLRASSNTTDFIFQSYDLAVLVKQAVKKYASVFIHSNIKLSMEEIHETILTDEKWLVFVMEQILSNALKYTKTGGTIKIYMQPPQILVIEDSGIGIQAEDLPRVFEEGYTGYNGHMDKKSTGIGLYLCNTIMEKLGHRIWITSEVGEGTKVMLDLTRKENSLTRM